VRIDSTAPGTVRLRFGQTAETLALAPDGTASGGGTRLSLVADGLWMERPQENHITLLRPAAGEARADFAGRYRCEELDAELTVASSGGSLYGAFSGFLGQGRMELLSPIGADLWALPCPRALDHTPPGDWTLALRRRNGRVDAIMLGCWLARRLLYERIG
jgi:D-aminopeptidase